MWQYLLVFPSLFLLWRYPDLFAEKYLACISIRNVNTTADSGKIAEYNIFHFVHCFCFGIISICLWICGLVIWKSIRRRKNLIPEISQNKYAFFSPFSLCVYLRKYFKIGKSSILTYGKYSVKKTSWLNIFLRKLSLVYKNIIFKLSIWQKITHLSNKKIN
jgi:hypothetical protein